MHGAIDLSDVKIDVNDDSMILLDSNSNTNLNESVNTVILQDDDCQSSLNTSVISVIKVEDSGKKEGEGDADTDAAKEAENLTLSIN